MPRRGFSSSSIRLEYTPKGENLGCRALIWGSRRWYKVFCLRVRQLVASTFFESSMVNRVSVDWVSLPGFQRGRGGEKGGQPISQRGTTEVWDLQ